MTKQIGVGGCAGPSGYANTRPDGCGGGYPPILVPARHVLERLSPTPAEAANIAHRNGTYGDWVDDVPIQGPTDRGIRKADCWWKDNVISRATDEQGAIVPQWTQNQLCIGNRLTSTGIGGVGETVRRGGTLGTPMAIFAAGVKPALATAVPAAAAPPGIWSKLSDAESHWVAATLIQLNGFILKAGNQPCATWPADLLKDDASAVAKMPAAVACFQGWYNANLKPQMVLRTDGTLDRATACALVAVTKEHPTDFTTPYPGTIFCGIGTLSTLAKVGIGVAAVAVVGGTIVAMSTGGKKKSAAGGVSEARKAAHGKEQYRVSMSGGRWRHFDSFKKANDYANEVFRRTGVIVAIERA